MSRFLLVILLLLPLTARASLVQPGDGPYQRLRHGHTLYVFDPTAADFIAVLSAYNESFHTQYARSFGWRLDEEQDLILTSPNQQIANAYATVFPNLKAVWFPAGAGMLEEMAESSWLLTLLSHETAHLYQLNPTAPELRGVKSVLGNTLVLFPFVWPVFPQPNFLLPTSLLEGNAVLNESRFGWGGRLHSGEARALVLAQIAAGQIDPVRLINDEFHFPFGETAYLQGGYFQAHLAAKYGVDKTNQFFTAQSAHYLWPLILNNTFRRHFGASYPQEVREYVRELQGLAFKQKSTPAPPVKESVFIGPLNHDDARVWWLSTAGDEPPRLNVWDKKSGHLVSSERIDLPLGKVFFEGARPLSVSSEPHDLHHIEYSLYGEGAALEPGFRGQIVTDRRAGRTVSLDARRSWLDPHILLNSEPYDIGHSRPVLDEQGHVYYFRQSGGERLLYRDREPMTKYDGYYGKLTEVDRDGAVYFIANTDYGSTLYRYKDQEIERMLDSDRVVDARRLGEGRFLAVEVGADGHRVVVAEASPRPQAPATYSYGFESANAVPPAAAVNDAKAVTAGASAYNSLTEMRYSGTDFTSTFSDDAGLGLSLLASFTDPLQYQALSFGYSGSHHQDRRLQAHYQFSKYLPLIYTDYIYNEDWWRRSDGARRFAHNQMADIGLGLPLLRHERWDARLDLALTYKAQEPHDDPFGGAESGPDDGETYGSLARLAVQWEVPTELGFLPWRRFGLSYMNQLDTMPWTWSKKRNSSIVQSQYTHGLPDEIYLSGSATYAWAERPDIGVKYDPYALIQDIRVPRLVSHDEYDVRNAAALRLEAQKVFTTPAYSARIPIGLNRLAPLVVGQGLFLDDDALNRYPASLFEWGWGVDFELLLLHKFPARVRLLEAYDTRDPIHRKDDQFNLSYKHEF